MNFQESRSLKSTANYVLAFILFISSTFFAGFTLPFRLTAKALKRKDSTTHIRDIKADNLDDVLRSENLVLIDFWAEWCGPCLMMNPVIEEFAGQNPEICVAKVNADTNGEIVKKFNIRGLPQFLLLKEGIEIKRHAGPMTKTDLTKFCKV